MFKNLHSIAPLAKSFMGFIPFGEVHFSAELIYQLDIDHGDLEGLLCILFLWLVAFLLGVYNLHCAQLVLFLVQELPQSKH